MSHGSSKVRTLESAPISTQARRPRPNVSCSTPIRIHAIHEVRGKDGVGKHTWTVWSWKKNVGSRFSLQLTHCEWADHHVNIIDTPGHVDFTVLRWSVPYECSMAQFWFLCSVGCSKSVHHRGSANAPVQRAPRVAFVNKMRPKQCKPFQGLSAASREIEAQRSAHSNLPSASRMSTRATLTSRQ